MNISDALDLTTRQYVDLRRRAEKYVQRAFPSLRREEVEDAVSEAILWLQSSHQLSNSGTQVNNLHALLVRDACFKAQHILRRRRTKSGEAREMQAEDEALQSILQSQSEEYTQDELKMRYNSIVEASCDLSTEAFDLFIRRFIEDQDVRAIATDLNITNDCAKKRIQRVRTFILQHPCVRDDDRDDV